jgi:large subunit ribosomal protein L17
MRHRKKGRKFNRTASHRKALLRNLANQLFEHKEIKTTTEKAKETRSTVERLITYAKKGDINHRRLAFGFLRNKITTKILFDEIAPAYTDRNGGYTRVLKLGRRHGDAANMSILQLIGFEKIADVSKSKSEKKKKTPKKTEEAKDDQTEAKENAASTNRTKTKSEVDTDTESGVVEKGIAESAQVRDDKSAKKNPQAE